MITLTGKLINIAKGENKDRETGEITNSFSAEILHQSRGKSVIESLKLDDSVVSAWNKSMGADITVEVRSYAMNNGKGGVLSGYALADKKSFPTAQHAAPQSLKAA